MPVYKPSYYSVPSLPFSMLVDAIHLTFSPTLHPTFLAQIYHYHTPFVVPSYSEIFYYSEVSPTATAPAYLPIHYQPALVTGDCCHTSIQCSHISFYVYLYLHL